MQGVSNDKAKPNQEDGSTNQRNIGNVCKDVAKNYN